MQTRGVDPRDIRWEENASTYRVYFWSRDGGHCDEHELSDVADVREVVAWADAEARDRVAEIFLRHDDNGEPGLIRLAGQRPGALDV